MSNIAPILARPVIVVQELADGSFAAFPLADPTLVSHHAHDEEACILEQRLFLTEHLRRSRADLVAEFELSPELEWIEVPVSLRREDLPAGLQFPRPIPMPCVLVDGRWVIVVGLHHICHVGRKEDVAEVVAEEIERIVVAREATPAEFLGFLPTRRAWFERLELELRPGEDQSRAREAADKARKAEAHARLLAIGDQLSLKDQPPLIGRDAAREAVAALVGGRERLSVALIGEELVGKSAVMLAALTGHARAYTTSGAQLMAGQSFFGQWQQQVHEVMQAAELLDAVLVFDDLSDLFAGRGGASDMASVMRPYLDARRVRLIGELRPDAVEVAESRSYGFFRNLHQVKLEPMTRAEAKQVLGARASWERRSRPQLPQLGEDAIEAVVGLTHRYVPYRAFPGKAIRFAEEVRAIVAADPHRRQTATTPTLEASDVLAAFSAQSGVPLFLLRPDRGLDYDDIVAFFRTRIIGQGHAIAQVARTVCTVKAQLQAPTRPLANLLFVGPTGVGKTEVARTLARYLFGSPDRMVRFDMSEFMDVGAAERLIRGTDREEGLLTRKVRQQPFCVVLLDELEKAHSSVFDLLLQVCGEGRLSDARGQTVFFNNAIVIMTSNLGAAHRRNAMGFGDGGPANDQAWYEDKVASHFRPEFMGRLDRIVAFGHLSPEEIHKVTALALDRVGERHGLAERGISLHVSPDATAALARGGYAEAYGARQLRRHVDLALVGPLAALLSELAGKARDADLHVQHLDEPEVDLDDLILLARRLAAPLRLTLLRHRTAPARRQVRDLAAVAELRRTVRRWQQLPPLDNLRDRIDFLTAQLSARPKKGKKRNQDAAPDPFAQHITQQIAEHHRLSAVNDRLIEAVAHIEDAEELITVAALDGEPVDTLADEVYTAERGYRVALAYGLVALETRRNAIHLMAIEPDQERMFDWWLPGLLRYARDKRWTLLTHLEGDADPAWPDWPADLGFGPPRSIDAMEQRLAQPRSFRRVLLTVDGEYAAAHLALEGGIHKFRNPPKSKEKEAWLHVRRVAFRKLPAATDLRPAPYRPSAFLAEAHLARGPHVREYDFNTQRLTLRSSAFGRLAYEDYWPRYEELAAQDLLDLRTAPGGDSLGTVLTADYDAMSFDEVKRLAKEKGNIAAIKLYRELTGKGLAESRDAVEALLKGEDPW